MCFRSVRWILWSELLRRVFDIDVLACPGCKGRMQVIAAIIKADVVAAILDALGKKSKRPLIRPTRPPPDLFEYSFPRSLDP